MAMYINSFLLSTLTMALMPIFLMFMVQSELLALGRNKYKDQLTGICKREWAIVLAGHFITIPKSLLNPTFLSNTGFDLKEHPL